MQNLIDISPTLSKGSVYKGMVELTTNKILCLDAVRAELKKVFV